MMAERATLITASRPLPAIAWVAASTRNTSTISHVTRSASRARSPSSDDAGSDGGTNPSMNADSSDTHSRTAR